MIFRTTGFAAHIGAPRKRIYVRAAKRAAAGQLIDELFSASIGIREVRSADGRALDAGPCRPGGGVTPIVHSGIKNVKWCASVHSSPYENGLMAAPQPH